MGSNRSKDLSNIPAVNVERGGVHFRYLVFQLQCKFVAKLWPRFQYLSPEQSDETRLLVRALNFRPYRDELEQQIINWTWQGLEEFGFDESGAQLSVGGGGTLNINPYYGTVTLFGESPEYGPEEERETVARLVQERFSGHEISWFETGYFKEQEGIAKKEKAKAAAERAARKAERQKSATSESGATARSSQATQIPEETPPSPSSDTAPEPHGENGSSP